MYIGCSLAYYRKGVFLCQKKNNVINIKIIAVCGMLAAISFLIGWVCKTYMTFGPIRITFDNIPVILAGICFGPLCGAAVGAIADLLSCVFSGFSVNIVITLGAASIGAVSGIVSNYILKKRGAVQVFTSTISAHIIGSMIIKSIGLSIIGFGGFVLFYRVPLYICISVIEFYVIYLLLKNKTFNREIEKIKR